MSETAVSSKAVVLLLFIHHLSLLPLFVGVLCLVLVLLCSTLCPLDFCNHLDEEERAGYITIIVFLKSYNC